MKSILLNRRPLKAVSLFASTDETRFVLNYVLLEIRRDSTLYVGTDGRTMAICRHVAKNDGLVSDDSCMKLLIHRCIVPQLQAAKDDIAIHVNTDQTWPLLRNEKKDFTIEWLGGGEHLKFPNWRHVVPQRIAESIHRITVNSELLTKFNDAIKTLDTNAAMILRGSEYTDQRLGSGPISIFCQGASCDFGFYGLLMEVLPKGDQFIPEWCRLPAAATTPPTAIPTPAA